VGEVPERTRRVLSEMLPNFFHLERRATFWIIKAHGGGFFTHVVDAEEEFNEGIFVPGRTGIDSQYAAINRKPTSRDHAHHADVVQNNLDVVARLEFHGFKVRLAHGRLDVPEAVGPGHEVVRNVGDRRNIEFIGKYGSITVDEARYALREKVARTKLRAAIGAVDVAVLNHVILYKAKGELGVNIDDLHAVIQANILNTVVVVILCSLRGVAARGGVAVDEHFAFIRGEGVLFGDKANGHGVEGRSSSWVNANAVRIVEVVLQTRRDFPKFETASGVISDNVKQNRVFLCHRP